MFIDDDAMQQFNKDNVEIKNSPIKGRGLYTLKSFKPGDVVCSNKPATFMLGKYIL